MRLIITLPDEDITRIAGEHGIQFVVDEFKRDPSWFLENSSEITMEKNAEPSSYHVRGPRRSA